MRQHIRFIIKGVIILIIIVVIGMAAFMGFLVYTDAPILNPPPLGGSDMVGVVKWPPSAETK